MRAFLRKQAAQNQLSLNWKSDSKLKNINVNIKRLLGYSIHKKYKTLEIANSLGSNSFLSSLLKGRENRKETDGEA